MDRAAVTRRVWELSEPLARAAGLELVDVQYRPEGGRLILRLLLDRFADRPVEVPAAGVTLDELARVSRELGDVLDAHDAVPGRYQLECSSPGLARPLVREAHFRQFVGRRVSVRTREPINGRRQFHGTLEGVEDGTVTVRDPDAGVVRAPLAAIEKANLEPEFRRPGGGPAAHA